MGSIIFFLAEKPVFKIIRGLLTSSAPRHLRDLASQYNLSPAGVSDILGRLKSAGVLAEKRRGNRKYFRLRISDSERECLSDFFSVYELELVRKRVPHYDLIAAARLAEMDEAYIFYKRAKRRTLDIPKEVEKFAPRSLISRKNRKKRG